MWFTVVLLLTVVFLLFRWLWLRKYHYWKNRNVPHIPGTFPFGSKRELCIPQRFQGTVTKEIYDQFYDHPYVGLYVWHQLQLLVCDPEILRIIMTKQFTHFRDRGRIFTSPNEPLLLNLFHLDGELWRPLRSKLTPTFTSGRIKNMFSLITVCAKQLDKVLKKLAEDNDEPIDIKDTFAAFTLDVISLCAFGLETKSAENIEFRKICRRIFLPYIALTAKIRVAICMIFPILPKLFMIKIVEPIVEDFIFNLITNTIKQRETNGVRKNDFLDLLIQLKNNRSIDVPNKNEYEVTSQANSTANNFEFTTELLVAQCFVFLAAGFETSSSVQSYALYELALNQDIQDRLRKEIDEVTEQHGGEISFQLLQELPYMKQVISEVVRKYPTIPVITRKCVKPFRMPDRPDIVIEKGTRIVIPIYGLHHDPKYFPNPEKFDPDRFTKENKAKIPSHAYLPFGEGPRQCIGKRFGMLQTKCGLYTTLRNYRVLPCKETPVPLQFVATRDIALTKGPIKLLIKPR